MQVKVWNKNTFVHKEKFKGDDVTIQPNSYVEMERQDAIDFRGQFTPIITDFDGQPEPKSYKIIEIEFPKDPVAEAMKMGHMCHACGKTYESTRMLEVHVEENHLDSLQDQELASKKRGRPKKEDAA